MAVRWGKYHIHNHECKTQCIHPSDESPPALGSATPRTSTSTSTSKSTSRPHGRRARGSAGAFARTRFACARCARLQASVAGSEPRRLIGARGPVQNVNTAHPCASARTCFACAQCARVRTNIVRTGLPRSASSALGVRSRPAPEAPPSASAHECSACVQCAQRCASVGRCARRRRAGHAQYDSRT